MDGVLVNEEAMVTFVVWENILDSHATFYAAHGEAGAIRKTGYYARLPLQWRHHCLGAGVNSATYAQASDGRTLYGVVGFVRLKIWMWRSAVPTTMSGYETSSV